MEIRQKFPGNDSTEKAANFSKLNFSKKLDPDRVGRLKVVICNLLMLKIMKKNRKEGIRSANRIIISFLTIAETVTPSKENFTGQLWPAPS